MNWAIAMLAVAFLAPPIAELSAFNSERFQQEMAEHVDSKRTPCGDDPDGSFKPGDAAGQGLPQFNISDLGVGTYRIYPSQVRRQNGGIARYLVLRTADGNLHVFAVPLHKGKFSMPDLNWWRVGPTCNDFRPDSTGDRLKADGVIRCHDPETTSCGDWYQRELRWTYDGENLGQSTADMIAPKYSVAGGWLIVGKG